MLSKAERTKQHLIETSSVLFNQQGYAGTSMSDITKASGLTKGAVYGHFADKDALAVACFDFNLHLIQRGILETEQLDAPAPVRLSNLMDAYRKGFPEVHSRGGCAIMNATAESGRHLPLLQARVQTSLNRWKSVLVNILLKGQKEGSIRESVATEPYATGIIAMIEGGILLAKAHQNEQAFYEVIDRLEQLFEVELYD